MTSPGDPSGPVVIGLREVYDAVLRLQGGLDQLAERVVSTRAECDERDQRATVTHGDHEQRLRSVERRQWPLPVVSAVLALAALIATVLPLLTGGPRR